MLDDILEIVFEFIIDLTGELLPKPVQKILTAVIVLALSGLLMYIGITDKSIAIVLIAVVIMLVYGAVIIRCKKR